MVIVGIFYLIPEIVAVTSGVGLVSQTMIGLVSSYLLYALVPISLFSLPLLLGRLAAGGLNLSHVSGLPLPARWQLLCLVSVLPTLGESGIAFDRNIIAIHRFSFSKTLSIFS
jgi:hypothetical protein